MSAVSPRALPIVYVGGNSRSGTTALSRVLGGHRAIRTFPELHFVEEMWMPGDPPVAGRDRQILVERLLHNADGDYLRPFKPGVHLAAAERLCDLRDLQPEDKRSVLHTVISSLTQSDGAVVACEQTPKNLFFLRELLEEQPQSVGVVITRDPRDVLLSQKKWWRHVFHGGRFPYRHIPWRFTVRRWADYHPVTTSMLWRTGAKETLRLQGHPRIVFISFEDLLASPSSTLEPLLSLLGLRYERSMEDIPHRNSSRGSDRIDSLGLNRSVIGNWRHGLTPAEVHISQWVTFPLADRLGYAREDVPRSVLKVGAMILYLPLKLTISALLRLTNPRSFAKSVALRLVAGSRGHDAGQAPGAANRGTTPVLDHPRDSR